MADNIYEILKKAESGDAIYQHTMGMNYQYGYGVPVDKHKSIEWFQKAAANGNSDSMRALGIIYESGIGVEQNLEKAFHYFQQSAEAGVVKSLEKLANFYEDGIIVEKDPDKAHELYERFFSGLLKQAESGNVDAMWHLGQIFQEGYPQLNIPVYYQQSVNWYEKAVNKGYKYAQTSLGILYYLGLGVPKSYKKAAQLYQQAADQGDAGAMYNLAGCYRLGRGVEQDIEKAATYNQKAANLDMPEAQAELAMMYFRGEGVEQDYTLSVYWYRKAIENGYANAYYGLGCCYHNGRGVEKDSNEGFRLFELGEQQGDRNCMLAVAECCIEGCGTKTDFRRAKEILEVICGEHENNEQNSLYASIAYENEQMDFWFNPLDEHMKSYYAKAYYLLGSLYYVGKGTGDGNVSKAIAMLRMAERLGYKNDELPEETAEKLLSRIINTSEKEEICDAVDCYVEIRERADKGERYDVVLHHADGTESVVKFKGRNKFIYILALLIAHEGKSVCGMTTTHFAYIREDLAKMAETTRINVPSYINWIDEFLYAEKDEAKDLRDPIGEGEAIGRCSLWPYRYSNAFSGANRAIKNCCVSDDEYETFKMRSTGGRQSITTMALDYSQIEIPDSLEDYLDILPTQKEIAGHIPEKTRKLPVRDKEERE